MCDWPKLPGKKKKGNMRLTNFSELEILWLELFSALEVQEQPWLSKDEVGCRQSMVFQTTWRPRHSIPISLCLHLRVPQSTPLASTRN